MMVIGAHLKPTKSPMTTGAYRTRHGNIQSQDGSCQVKKFRLMMLMTNDLYG